MYEYRKRALLIILGLVIVLFFLPAGLETNYAPAGFLILVYVLMGLFNIDSTGGMLLPLFGPLFAAPICLYLIYAC